MFMLAAERITPRNLRPNAVVQKFLKVKQEIHLEGSTVERTVFTVVMPLQKEIRKPANPVML